MFYRRNRKGARVVPTADMTPMIDMVFQLLIFFILMFKIVAPEGDFSIKMPVNDGVTRDELVLPPPPQTSVIVRLHADSAGRMTDIGVGAHTFRASETGFREMKNYVRTQLGSAGPAAAAATKIELDCDYNLRYTNVVKIISLCTGYVENGKVVKLAEKIEFRSPRKTD